ncbi:MAG TPA: hypothetical protein VHO24_06350 [Opitutaceae bacterium]|nr:hypothetical protein [Opitutaceae bacterium]
MTDNVLIPLPSFTLPADFPWRVRFIAAVDEHLRRLRATGHFRPSRFFGYYFRGDAPIGVSGNWTVTLDPEPPLVQLRAALERVTQGQFSIASDSTQANPDFLLVHDRRDGACWLWRFEYGLRFVEAIEAVTGEDRGGPGQQPENRRLLGP